MKKIFQPFQTINRKTMGILLLIQLIIAVTAWHTLSTGLIPQPLKVAQAFFNQVTSTLLLDNILISLLLTLKAMFIAIIITLVFCYLSVIPFFKYLAELLVKCRYLTLTGLIFIFTLLTQNGSQLKLSLLIFGIVPFFVTSFLSVIVHINRQEYDLCMTLGYSRWHTLYEVIIVGKAHLVFEIMRQNFAIAWLMITLVEGLSMSEGGVGTLLIKYNKYNDMANVLALQGVIFLVGVGFDYLLGALKKWFFPYTRLAA